MFWFFHPEACGILAPWPKIEPAPSALEGEVLTTGPPGKSQEGGELFFFFGRTSRHEELPRPGIEPAPLQCKRGVLTTALPGKPCTAIF